MNNKKDHVNTITKKQLIESPRREWDKNTSIYTSILISPSKQKHCSGWSSMTIVGCVDFVPKEILTSHSDDINWSISAELRTDCTYPAGILHFWSKYGLFKVGYDLSSIDIKVAHKDEIK